MPIHIDLNALSAEIDAQVPRTFSGTARQHGVVVHYDVRREPIRLQMIGAGLHAIIDVNYSLEARGGRFRLASCGLFEPRREATVRLQTALDWQPSWQLRSSTRVLPVDYTRRCGITGLDIDVTRFISPVVEPNLRAAAALIDRRLPRVAAVRPQAERIWMSLQTPVQLAPRTWLTLEPVHVALAPIAGSGPVATTTLALRALTRVTVGNAPAPRRVPLPPLSETTQPPSGFRVPFDIGLSYHDASVLAMRELGGKVFQVNGRPLRIESVSIGPGANGRVELDAVIDYRGGPLRGYHGRIVVEGTPRFTAGSSIVDFPDLDYTLADRGGFLTRFAERAAHDAIRERLRQSARFDLTERIAAVRAEVTRAMTRQLAPGVQMRGTVDAIEPVSVTPHANGISIRVIATGRAVVTWNGR